MSTLRHALLAVTLVLAVSVVTLRFLNAGPFAPANGTMIFNTGECLAQATSVDTGKIMVTIHTPTSAASPQSFSLAPGPYLVRCTNIPARGTQNVWLPPGETINVSMLPFDVAP